MCIRDRLKHLKQLVEYVTGMDTRVGLPNEHLAGNNSIEISNPTFATAVGLVMNSMKNRKNLNMNQKTLIDSNKDNIENDEEINSDEDDVNENATISPERYAEMSASENLILTITSGGAGKLSSSHDYPVRGRGGMGVAAMDKTMRGGAIVASFPVELEDQIMLATSNGQSIRVPVEGISFRSRSAGGVKVFDTKENEEVVSVAWIADQGDDAEENHQE